MAKDKSEKKERKEKKEKRAEKEGVKKEKKEKKEKKSKDVIKALEAEIEKSESPEPMQLVKSGGADVAMGEDELLGALVPFAFPLVEEAKELKKVLKTVKKSAKTKTLRRGVKEVVKALRKSETSGPASSDITDPPAVCIIAADISPMDVISHIPVLCEDHNIPYVYVKSRAELGEASATKRPTSVVMVAKERTSKKKDGVKDDDVTEFQEAYGDLVKLAVKASKSLRK
ncbi:50S ribosomal protein L30e-like protein [Lophiotrema nucula]|uniref:50S ribosomal protein L30e-like protein n=1 Tax=Lophiotrema nucula TaxID=690887 RepID=A0A6A5YZD8_9PLEO|nr:50S ribosomal protein L30e-like protein [Lophiotrema nucula]